MTPSLIILNYNLYKVKQDNKKTLIIFNYICSINNIVFDVLKKAETEIVATY